MKRVVIFTEGRTELIFVRELLLRIIDNNDLSFDCLELKAGKSLPFPYKQTSPTAIIHFQIISVGNDESVLSEIKNRCSNFTNQGVEIIGLRDMYSEAYKKFSNQIDQRVINDIRVSHENIVRQIAHNELIHLFFAIMEVEAWFLAMYRIFERIDASLTVENIRRQLNYDLESDDPENTYFHPAVQLSQILRLIGRDYKKHQSDVLGIVSQITEEDIRDLINTNFCSSFTPFHAELQREYLVSLNMGV